MKVTTKRLHLLHSRGVNLNKLLEHLGKNAPDDEPVSMRTVFDVLGLSDAMRALSGVSGFDKEISLFMLDCIEMGNHLLNDHRSIEALQTFRRYHNGLATAEKLNQSIQRARDAAHEETCIAMRHDPSCLAPKKHPRMAQLVPPFMLIHIALQDMDWLCRTVAHFIADHATLAAALSIPPFTRQIKEQERIYGHVFRSIRDAQKEAFLKLLDTK